MAELVDPRAELVRCLRARNLQLQRARLREALERNPALARQIARNVLLGPHVQIGPFCIRVPIPGIKAK